MKNKVLAVITPDTILQDDYIQAVRNEGLGDYLQPEEKAEPAESPAFNIGMGYLGNGLTVWNRAVEENGDYQTIAHISSEGEIRYYVDGLPDDVVSMIEPQRHGNIKKLCLQPHIRWETECIWKESLLKSHG